MVSRGWTATSAPASESEPPPGTECGGNAIHILQIEHPVPDFDAWKKAFDADPVGRKRAGVRRYRIFRPTDDANYAIVELEFDSLSEAEALLASLRELWRDVDGKVMTDPRARIVEAAETVEY
jgi:hypothetical protein